MTSGLAAGLPVDKGGVVKHSEFWNAVEAVFGTAYGRSLAQDLVLPGLGVTCVQALDEGVDDEHRLQQVVRRTVGQWVSSTYRRRPMIVPVVIEA